MKKYYSIICFFLVLSFIFIAPAYAKNNKKVKVKQKGPPSWAPAHGYRKKFKYYPGSKVFYDGTKNQYYWIDGGVVKYGTSLPVSIKLGGTGVSIELPRLIPKILDFK